MISESRKRIPWIWTLMSVLLVAFGLSACTTGEQTDGETATQDETEVAEEPTIAPEDTIWPPEHILVQHVLIGYEGSVPGKPITRSKEEASALAQEILDRAKAGEDFGALVREYTDDSAPGFYRLANQGVDPQGGDEYPRGEMVKGFGDVAFELKVGDVGVASYDEKASPYGWHIIQRLSWQ